jgi:hypothetical protein
MNNKEQKKWSKNYQKLATRKFDPSDNMIGSLTTLGLVLVLLFLFIVILLLLQVVYVLVYRRRCHHAKTPAHDSDSDTDNDQGLYTIKEESEESSGAPTPFYTPDSSPSLQVSVCRESNGDDTAIRSSIWVSSFLLVVLSFTNVKFLFLYFRILLYISLFCLWIDNVDCRAANSWYMNEKSQKTPFAKYLRMHCSQVIYIVFLERHRNAVIIPCIL